VLIEQLVGFGVQCVGRRVPNDLVDAEDVEERSTAARAAKADQEALLLLTVLTSIGPLNGIEIAAAG
jgi:hypothetical protein